MEPVPALVAVGASYIAYLLGWRRIRVAQGRRKGPALQALARYDHRALAVELAATLAPANLEAAGSRIVPIPTGTPLGPMPEPWATAPWAFAKPSALADARDALLLGVVEEAVTRSTGAPAALVASLFGWAFCFRVFSGEADRALAVANAYAALPGHRGDVANRLLAQAHSLFAEGLGPGREREVQATLGLARWKALEKPSASPALSGLGPHLEILRLGWWNLEIGEWTTRRRLRRALSRFPDAPVLHLIRAHLAASLGEGQRAADHLAKALYYARGDTFYARPIVESPWLSFSRPTLAARARGLLKEERDGGTGSD